MENVLAIINEQEVLGKDFKVYGTFEEPLFLAKDVAVWIEHSNPRMMLQKVDEDEKTKELCPVNNPYGGYQVEEQWFLTEDGLYEVLMQSRKPIAKQFKKEVKKILKALRTGKAELVPQLSYDEQMMIQAHRQLLECYKVNKTVTTRVIALSD